MNILLTCAGRRSYLVDYFKELKDVNEVHTANSIKDTPAMLVADYHFQTPSIYKEGYVDLIIEYCKKHDIKMVISLLDLELTILSKKKQVFEEHGILLAISNYQICKICNDKYATQEFLKANNFPTVHMFLSTEEAIKAVYDRKASFPFFIKPRWGMGSIGVYQVENEEELKVLYLKVKKELQKTSLKEGSKALKGQDVIIQENLPGEEFGLDVFNNFKGNHIKTFVKKKITMRAGETDAAVTVANPTLEELGKNVSKKLKHYGNLDMDVFFDGKTAYILELNPRFGGGYPFTHLAGGNIVKAYIDLYNNRDLNLDDYHIGLKYFKSISFLKA
jgi:carbamoyl-phosphate synthase large subunit